MLPPHVADLVAVCRECGIKRFYGSPGSRSAPLLLALSRTGHFHIEMIPDERSAAYRALGYSLASGEITGLFCTSGTAALNFVPAVAEAFYQKGRLLVLTADRPPELIDQQEGQAVRQQRIFEDHCVFSATVPSFDFHPAARVHAVRLFRQALHACMQPNGGPVHLNFPFREPFYPEKVEQSPAELPATQEVFPPEAKLSREQLSTLIEKWNASGRRLLLAGQMLPDFDLSNACKALSEYARCPVLGDGLHNLEPVAGSVLHPDNLTEDFLLGEDARPDILLSIGNGHLSKSLRRFLSENPATEHWHVQEAGYPADPYGSIRQVINAKPEWLITRLAEASCFSDSGNHQLAEEWFNGWVSREFSIRNATRKMEKELPWSDLTAVADFLSALPSRAAIFTGNSMPVRYAMWLNGGRQWGGIFSNRGTSGIDGCVSSAMGVADALPGKEVYLLIGDMGFLYDRNAFWTRSIPANLKVFILNNGGGNIFRIIPSSSSLPEMPDFFELRQTHTSEGTCLDAGIARFTAATREELQHAIPAWMDAGGCAVLEVFTDKEMNQKVVKDFRDFFRNGHIQ